MWTENILASCDILSSLNEEQKEAVVHTGSPLLILAGAGSGKTRVITTKIAYLISELNYDARSILAVTFTKKAATEMKERAIALEEKASNAQIKTFHSFGAMFLRLYGTLIDISENFTVYDDDDMCSLLTKIRSSITKKQASKIAHSISLAKDYCLSPDSPDLCFIDDDKDFPEIYREYQNRLKATGNVDFGDLIMLPYLILKNNPGLKEKIQRRFRVIMVDEYQDSNVAQFNLLQELCGSETYVCVVGDDDQSIYKFRGAEVKNILEFQNVFSNTKIIRLEKNYRSYSEILNCANSLVSKNTNRLGKKLVSVKGNGKKPTLVFLPNQNDESDFCANLIQQSYEKGVPYKDWAILYRTNAQSLEFESNFLHKKIPYVLVGSLKFFSREEIKDALAWISLLVNPKDEIAFRRIINKPARGIGETSQDKIVNSSLGESLVEGAKSVQLTKKASEGVKSFSLIFEKLSTVLPSNPKLSQNFLLAQEAMEEENSSLKNNSNQENEKNLSEFIQLLIEETGLQEYYKELDKESDTSKLLNLQELSNHAMDYPFSKEGLMDFIDDINLDRSLEGNSEKNQDSVTLITLHNTKGLEFPRVIITGMENGIFPRQDKTQDELEEERRLFYVGITRAKDELYFTSCSNRRLFGKTNFMSPSVFLYDIDKDLIRTLGNNSSFINQNISSSIQKKYSKGKSLYHDDYGYGYISDGYFSSDGDYVIDVVFETGAKKRFLPEYQKSSLIIDE